MYICFLNIALGALFLYFFRRALRQYLRQGEDKLRRYHNHYQSLSSRIKDITAGLQAKEGKIYDIWNIYQINKQLLGILSVDKLCKLFINNLRRLIYVEDAQCLGYEMKGKGYIIRSFRRLDKTSYLHIKCPPAKEKQILHIISQYQLIFQRAKMYERFQELSVTDELTGLYNRRYFIQRFQEEFSRARKFKLDLSFFMIDIDNFKSFNDQYGHLVGDAVLKNVASVLLGNLREIDFLSRWGGEEFAVILPETEKSHALAIGERIRKKVEKTEFSVYDEKIAATVSVGVASFPSDVQNRDLLLELADRALYKAKQEGKNRVAFF